MSKLLGLERSTVAKGETGKQVPSARTLERWLDVLDVRGLARSAMESMWALARRADADPSDTAAAPWYATEASAHTLRYWAPIVIPGVVQSAEYAQAIFGAMGYDAARVKESLDARLRRQTVLTRDDAPDVSIVIWEPVLRHQIGSAGAMRAQIEHLLLVSELPTVAVHVLPGGANPGLGGAIGLASSDDAPDLLVRDAVLADDVTSDASLVRLARVTFSMLRKAALDHGGSQRVLQEAARTWTE